MAVSQVWPAYADPGDLDTTFSGDGLQMTDFFSGTDAANAVAIQADGKIVVAGYATTAASDYDFALARYNANGTLDSNFDGDGRVTTDFQGGDDVVGAVVIQPDGKILVAGAAVTTASGNDFALARYNPDGSPDTSFSGNGRRVTDILGEDQALGVALQADGKIVVAGVSYGSTAEFALARYNPNGALDTTFSIDGIVTTDFAGENDIAFDVVLQTDGKIVVAGYAGPSGNVDFALARYETDGDLDNTFSFDGKATVDFSSGDDVATDVVVQPDGKIVAAGQVEFTDMNFGVARFLADGTLDNSFSGNGRANTDFGFQDTAFEVLLQPGNKLLVVGGAVDNPLGPEDPLLPDYWLTTQAPSGASNFALAR
jgi:uncharacterized delta-60 repeat protein